MFGKDKKIKELECKLKDLETFVYDILGDGGVVLKAIENQQEATSHVISAVAQVELWVARHEGIEIDKH